MIRARSVRTAAALLAGALAPTVGASQGAPPNIVILLADDLGHTDVGYRNPSIQTPRIDALAASGVRLERFYVSPVCSPTRAALMSGRYPHRFGMGKGVVEPTRVHGLPANEETIAELLARAGYARRAAIGKWHLGHSSVRYHPLSQGFTSFYGHYNGAIDYFTHTRAGELDWHRDHESSYDGGYSTDLMAAEAERFIRDSRPGEPFLLYLAWNAVHSPMQATAEDLARHGFDAARGTFPEGTGGSQAGERGLEGYGRIGNGNTTRQTYLAMLSGLDRGVGRVLDALDRQGLAENTLVLFLSDNGGTPRFGGDNRPLRGNKASTWEGGVRVNAIARWPARLAGGRTENRMLAHVDLLPTLARIAGVTPRPAGPLDGVDALEILGGAAAPDRALYLGAGTVVTQRWKLVDGQLFDLERDPYETTDLAAANPAVMARLQGELARLEALAGPPSETGRFTTPPEWRMPDAPAARR